MGSQPWRWRAAWANSFLRQHHMAVKAPEQEVIPDRIPWQSFTRQLDVVDQEFVLVLNETDVVAIC